MHISPKKTKYRFKFRNKIQTQKIKVHDFRLQNLYKPLEHPVYLEEHIEKPSRWGVKKAVVFNNANVIKTADHMSRNHAWLPNYESTREPTSKENHWNSLYWKCFTFNTINNSQSKSYSDTIAYIEPYFQIKTPLNSMSYDSYMQSLFGNYAVAFKTHGKLSAKFIETVSLDLARSLKKKARIWLRLCCDTPVTARPVETRMGKGKGAISYWEAKVRPGQILFEFDNIDQAKANALLQHLRKKSPCKLKAI